MSSSSGEGAGRVGVPGSESSVGGGAGAGAGERQDQAVDGQRPDVPPMLAVDAAGYVWRVYPDHWSMAPSNPDNEPVPGPVTYYAPTDAPTDEQGTSGVEVAVTHSSHVVIDLGDCGGTNDGIDLCVNDGDAYTISAVGARAIAEALRKASDARGRQS